MKGGVRERSKGKYSYYFKYKDEYGKWRTKEKGGFSSKKEAQSALRKAITEFEEEGFVANKTTYTLNQFIEYWFENVAHLKLKPASLISYRSIIKNHITNDIGNIKLDAITPTILQKFFAEKTCEHSDSVILGIKKILNPVFKFALKQKIIKYNPMASIEGIASSVKSPKKKFLSLEDIENILESFSTTPYYLPARIAVNTGLRRGEILGLTWNDIDFETEIIDVNKQLIYTPEGLTFSTTKTKTSNRKVRITPTFAEELKIVKKQFDERKEYYSEHFYQGYDFVCCHEDGRPLHPYSMTSFFTRNARRMNIEFTFHMLRHAHASFLLEADVNIKVIQERLGHSEIKTTLDTYSHVSENLESESINKLEKFFATKK